MEWYTLLSPAIATYKGARWSYRTLAQKIHARKEKQAEFNRQRVRFEKERELERQRVAAIPRTADAQTQMRLSLQYLDHMDKISAGMQKQGYGYDIKDMREHLDKASRALDNARKLDPNATHVEELKDGGSVRWTVDTLAAHILSQEAEGYATAALNYEQFNYGIMDESIWQKMISKPAYERKKAQFQRDSYIKAIRAVERALEFSPNNQLYIKKRADFYLCIDDFKKAREILDEGIARYPDNLDFHRLKQDYFS